MQLSENSLDPTIPFPVISNVGTVRVDGVEFAVAARPSRWLDLNLDFAYAHARFGAGTVDRSLASTCTPEICQLIPAPPSGHLAPAIGGNQLPGAPEMSASLSATLHGNLDGDLHWYARADFYAASRQYMRTDNLNWLSAQRIPSARVGLTSKHWELSLWGRNLNSTLRSDHAALATADSGLRQFVVDRANGASWGLTCTYHSLGGS
jgi:outer membrane receptor protein involved in Fe transport